MGLSEQDSYAVNGETQVPPKGNPENLFAEQEVPTGDQLEM